MPTSSLARIPQTYPELLSAVRRVLIDGQREIVRVWVCSNHEIRLRQGYGGQAGRLITEHILLLRIVARCDDFLKLRFLTADYVGYADRFQRPLPLSAPSV